MRVMKNSRSGNGWYVLLKREIQWDKSQGTVVKNLADGNKRKDDKTKGASKETAVK